MAVDGSAPRGDERRGTEQTGTDGAAASGPNGRAIPDFERVEHGRRVLSSLGVPVDFWEALCLATRDDAAARPSAAGASGDLSNPVVRGAIAAGLRHLRDELGPLARELRFFLERSSTGFDSARAERVIGLVLSSEREREAAWRWIADPASSREDAAERIARLSGAAEPHGRPGEIPGTPLPARDPSLKEAARAHPAARAAAPPAALSCPAMAAVLLHDGTPAPAGIGTPSPAVPPSHPPAVPTVAFEELTIGGDARAPKEKLLPGEEGLLREALSSLEEVSHPEGARLDPEKERDLARARAWARAFPEPPCRVELWEIFYLITIGGEAIRAMVDDLLLLRGREAETSGVFREGASHLFEKVLGVRWEWGGFVAQLREYLSPLAGPRATAEAFESAIGVLVAAPGGRERAAGWLAAGESGRTEAESYLKTVLRIVERHVSAPV